MFCKGCGTKLPDGAKFCTACGTQSRRQSSSKAKEAQPVAPFHGSVNRSCKNGRTALLLTVSIILILLGLGHMALSAAGRTIPAQVTNYEQQYIINNDESTRNPSRYKLEYQFAVNGERYTGSVTRVFPGGSHMRQTILVRYLPFWPHMNAEDDAEMGLTGPVIMGLGVLMLALALRKKSPR